METQNITLSLPKEILRKVKLLAVEKGVSVSGLLVQTLEELVRQDERYREARQRSLDLLEKGLDLGTNGKASWKRQELHER